MTNDEMVISGALLGCVIFCIVVALIIRMKLREKPNPMSKTNPIYEDNKDTLKRKENFSDDHDPYYTDENIYETDMDIKVNSKKLNENEKYIYSEIPIQNINISEYQSRTNSC